MAPGLGLATRLQVVGIGKASTDLFEGGSRSDKPLVRGWKRPYWLYIPQ
jgi:hypothetical protein